MFLNPKSFNQLKISDSKIEDPMSMPFIKISPGLSATNITVKDVQQLVDLLIASAKLKNTPTLQGLDSFYITGNFTTVQVDLTIECQQEDSIESIDAQITEQVSS